MKYKQLLLLLFLFVLVPLNVFGVSGNYPVYGGNEGHAGHVTTFTQLTNFISQPPGGNNNGTVTQPVVDDINNDGYLDVFTGSGDIIYALNGDFEGVTQSSLGIGKININPVICDVNNDGTKEYVVVVNNGSAGVNYLWGLDLNSQSQFSASGVPAIVNVTNVNGNIACGQFYLSQSDQNYYVMFLDQNKRLYIMRQTSSGWVGSNVNVGESVSIPTATTEETNFGIGTGVKANASYQIAYSKTFDPLGMGSILFHAGRYAYVYFSDTDAKRVLVNTSLSTAYNPQSFGTVKVYGEIHDSPTGTTSAALLYDGSLSGLITNANALILLKVSGGVTGTFFEIPRSLDIVGVINDLTAHQVTSPFPTSSALSIAPCTGCNGRDYLYILSQAANNNCNIAFPRCTPYLTIRKASDLSVVADQGYYWSSFIPYTAATAAVVTPQGLMSIQTADFNKDGSNDILFTTGRDEALCIGYAPFNVSLSPIFNCFANISAAGSNYASPVLYDHNSVLSVVSSFNTATNFYSTSSTAGVTVIPFNVSFLGGLSNTSFTKVQVQTIGEDFTYNYALACNIGDSTIFNELFRNGYTFSDHNVSTGTLAPESLLSNNGVTFTYTNASQTFFLAKNGNSAERDRLRTTIPYQYSTTGNSVVDVFWLSGDSQVTYALEINKTGTTYRFKRLDLGGVLTNLSTQTITTGLVNLQVVFNPVTEAGTGREFYTVQLLLGNTSIGNDTTYSYFGTTVQSIEWYSDYTLSINQTVTVISMGLTKSADYFPEFLQFSQPEQLTLVQPQQTILAGDGYTVLTISNNTFASYCFYNAPGTYTQRHYIAQLNDVDDYTNYRDFSVTVQSAGAIAVDENGNPIINLNPSIGDGTGDLAGDLLPVFLDSIGLHSTNSKLLFWVILSLIVAGLLFAVNPLLGLLSFVVMIILGVVLSIVSLWVVIIFVIISAALFALGVRYLIGGK